jgi:hypothetical protein
MKRKMALILILGAWSAGCGPKTVTVDVPTGYAEAQTAGRRELLDLINQRYASVDTLTVSRFRVEFRGGSIERGYLKEYPSAKGYLAARRPDSIYLNILNPVTSSTVVAMAATEGEFEIWVPRENKFLTGSTSVRLSEEEPIYSVRPDHLLEAILVEPVPLDDPRYGFFIEQERDPTRKYYVVSVIDLEAAEGLCLSRKIWIDRADLRLARQRYYECGAPVSDIEYGPSEELGDRLLVSRRVSVERVREAYRFRLEWEPDAVRFDQPLKENAFHIPRPPGAELVVVRGDS